VINHTASVVINRPVADVFKYTVEDYVANHPKWDPRVVRMETESKPIAVGFEGREVRKQMGRENNYAFRVTELEPSKQFAFEARGGPALLQWRQTTEPAEGGTRLTLLMSLSMSGPMRLFEPLMGGSFRKEMDSTAAKIKELIEAG
jgi:hypothetical protein